MNKKITNQIHSILLPLWQYYNLQDIWEDVKNWKIDDTEAIRRIKLISDDFETEAEYKLFTDQHTSIEELAELYEECVGNERNLDDELLYKEVSDIIKEYSKAYMGVVFNEYDLAEGQYTPSDGGEEFPPEYIRQVQSMLAAQEAAKALGSRGGNKTSERGTEYYKRISALGKKALRAKRKQKAGK